MITPTLQYYFLHVIVYSVQRRVNIKVDHVHCVINILNSFMFIVLK